MARRDQQASERATRITYLMREEGTDWTKIGCTTTPHSLYRRLQNNQSGNPRKLTVAAVWLRLEEAELASEIRTAYSSIPIHYDSSAGFDLEQKLIAEFCAEDRPSDWTTATVESIVSLWRTGL